MFNIVLNLPQEIFNPETIMKSGQVFRIKRKDNTFYAYSSDKMVEFTKVYENDWLFETLSQEDWRFWENYFDFSTNYSEYNKIIQNSKDKFLQDTLKFGKGMRILKQDLWETMVTFIISQQNNIPKITKTVEIFCEKFGSVKSYQKDFPKIIKTFHAFPTSAQIANLSQNSLQDGTLLGYRAKYILKIAQDIENGKFKLSELQKLDYTEAIAKLKTIYGVGDKVANCIALYGLYLMESYPIDVWMSKIIEQDYSEYKSTQEYLKYINSSYSGFQGYIQQLQFFFKRNKKF